MDTTRDTKILPFMCWAGGKQKLKNTLLKYAPDTFNTYYEPFVGAGSLFLALAPKRAHISDSHPALICTWKALRDDLDTFCTHLENIDLDYLTSPDLKVCYRFYRELYNKRVASKVFDTYTAALFLFLIKHCYNATYRTNKQGEFNVPSNAKHVHSFKRTHLERVADVLQGIDITCGDFADACVNVEAHDFVYFDSPYIAISKTRHRLYNKDGFSNEDHKRLADLFSNLTQKGAYCMLSEHDTPFVRKLYRSWRIREVQVRRSIDMIHPQLVNEVIVTNY
ncbi:DNA adenine methylase [Eggerthellaceae bacterium PR-HUZ602407-17]